MLVVIAERPDEDFVAYYDESLDYNSEEYDESHMALPWEFADRQDSSEEEGDDYGDYHDYRDEL